MAEVGYKEKFDELNSSIIVALASDAPEEIKHIIENYNVNKRSADFVSEIKGYDKDLLVQAMTFLKSKSATMHRTTLAKAILIGIQNFLYERCEACDNYYVIKYHDTPSIRCKRCEQGCHEPCYSVCKQLPGIEWLCSSCNQDIYPAAGDDKPGDAVPDKSDDKSGDGAKAAEDPEKGELSEHEEDKEEDDGIPNDPPPCRFFTNARCKHGLSGKNCKFKHEKVCKKFFNNGRDRRYGCTKGRNCELFHPKMCFNSLDHKTCTRPNCKYYHIRGTDTSQRPPNTTNSRYLQQENPRDQRDNERQYARTSVEQGANQPWEQNPNNPQSGSDQHFLAFTKQLEERFTQMHQQQMLMMDKLRHIETHPHPQAMQIYPQAMQAQAMQTQQAEQYGPHITSQQVQTFNPFKI